MEMPSLNEAVENAGDVPAFSNGHEWDCWSARWCARCVNEPDCPLIFVALSGATPAEWRETNPGGLSDRYTCPLFTEAK
jgi:hypothetical protein